MKTSVPILFSYFRQQFFYSINESARYRNHWNTVKPVLSDHRKQDLSDRWQLNKGRKKCRKLQLELSALLWTCIMLPSVYSDHRVPRSVVGLTVTHTPIYVHLRLMYLQGTCSGIGYIAGATNSLQTCAGIGCMAGASPGWPRNWPDRFLPWDFLADVGGGGNWPCWLCCLQISKLHVHSQTSFFNP